MKIRYILKPKNSLFFAIAVNLFALSSLLFWQVSTVSAQSTTPTNEMKSSYKKLCTELNKINSSSGNSDNLYKKYCGNKTPTTIAKMNSAAYDICKDYGSNRLKDECKDYREKNNGADSSGLQLSNGEGGSKDQCGKGENAVKTKFNFGCVGNSYPGATLNPILDVSFAVIKFLSAGVGLLVVASIIWAGIQYSSSQGNPEQTQIAKTRIQNSIIGLVLYLFIFALVQYLVPGGLL